MNPPEREWTLRIAFGLVLVAWTVSSPFFQVAVWIATRSGGAGAPGVTVIVVVRVTPNHRAVIVTVVVVDTGDVVTGKKPFAWPPLTTSSDGTWTTAGLLLESWTTRPSVVALNVIVPVAGLPPLSADGVTDTAVSDGPAGVAAFTWRLADRGVLPVQAVIVTFDGGAAAFVATGNVADVAPAGTVTVAGTVATEVSLLNTWTVVGDGSAKASETVPCEDAPSRTESGDSDREEMLPAAPAAPGSRRATALAATAARGRRRRMGTSFQRLGVRAGPCARRGRRGAGRGPLARGTRGRDCPLGDAARHGLGA